MLASLFAGVAGLRSHQTRMNVIGNNISNINTIGYKAGRSIFEEALIQTLRGAGRPSAVSGGTNPIQLGLGISVASIDNIFTQGGLEVTNKITDLAIQGNGFFVLSDGEQQFYTRAGAFGFDANSYMVNPSNGLYVLGKMANDSGIIPSEATIGKIKLPFGQQDPAKETSVVDFGNNLDASVSRSIANLTEGVTPSNGIAIATGTARDGAGGTHIVNITGSQATQANSVGAHISNPPALLTGVETLQSLGVDDTSLTISVDGDTAINITGLTLTSTVNDLISLLDAVVGLDAELVSGEVRFTRTKAGLAGTVATNAAVATTGTEGNIINRILGAANGVVFQANNGTDHSFTAIDTFTHVMGGSPVATNLTVLVDENTGLATGLEGLGDGGVTVQSGVSGLSAGTASITTQKTEKATSIVVYDSLGARHTMLTNFVKSQDANKWLWEISMQGGEILNSGSSGDIVFSPEGALESFHFNGGAEEFSFDPNNGAGPTEITLDVGTTGQYNGITGFAGSESIAALGQNGYGMGILEKIEIDPTGLIVGIFNNGVSRALAQLLVADFSNEAGLNKSGRSLFIETANSGEAIAGIAGETVSATITSGALESANVDLAQEFTAMIIAQRGFQSNARVITTSDNMLDDLVNLKR